MYITIIPKVNASTTESRIAEMIPIARSVLMKFPKSANESASVPAIFEIEIAIAEPNKQKISDTVVEVGKPQVL